MATQKNTKLSVLITLALTSVGTIWGAVVQPMRAFDIAVCIVGMAALAYTVYFITFFITEKIQRDVILVKKQYWVWVILLVVAIPFVFTRYMLLADVPSTDMLDEHNTYALVPEEGDPKAGAALWSVFFHYIDPGNQHISVSSGRTIGGIVTLLGIILFNGLLLSTILSWIDRRKEQWYHGAIRYPLKSLPKNRYAVVIGANEVAVSVIKNLLQQSLSGIRENEYVILQTSSDVEEVREHLSAHLSEDEQNRVICYNALRNSEKEIRSLHLPYANIIYILGESTTNVDAETGHDALNMHSLNLIAEELYKHKTHIGDGYVRKACRVMFDFHTTYSVFQFSDLPTKVRETMVFSPFNVYEAWASKVLVEHQAYNNGKPIYYTPLDGTEGLHAGDDKRVHLVIVGMSQMGIAMGKQALYHAHYLNYNKQRTRITFIDSEVDAQMAFFKGQHATLFELMRHRYVDANESADKAWIDPMAAPDCPWKHLSEGGRNFIDTEVEFVKGNIESDGVRAYLREIASDSQSKLTIAVCLNRTNKALAASLYMPVEVYESKQLQDIWVYQREVVDMIDNLTDPSVVTTSIRYKKLRPFGMYYGEGVGNQKSVQKAMLVNASYDVLYNQHEWPKNMQDPNDKGYQSAYQSWHNLMINKKWSNCFFADSIDLKIRSVYDANKHSSLQEALQQYETQLAVCEHNRWNMEQLLMGYSPCKKADDELLKQLVEKNEIEAQQQTKRELKLSAAKVHPNICDYEHLSSIDPAAKEYDIQLIYAIPKILSLVES